jgi:hypothetical protein
VISTVESLLRIRSDRLLGIKAGLEHRIDRARFDRRLSRLLDNVIVAIEAS